MSNIISSYPPFFWQIIFFLNICPLSTKSHALIHPQPWAGGSHLKDTWSLTEICLPCVWQLNWHSKHQQSLSLWLQRSKVGLSPDFSPGNSRYQSHRNCNVHRNHLGFLGNSSFRFRSSRVKPKRQGFQQAPG